MAKLAGHLGEYEDTESFQIWYTPVLWIRQRTLLQVASILSGRSCFKTEGPTLWRRGYLVKSRELLEKDVKGL